MPTTIDIENAKQIRQPMDVLITMQVPDDDISLTFSGYASTAKVADGVLAQKSWPMRTLADLQGDGFSLGGSAVLYDSSTSASQANGKLGVRGNIGQPVSLTVTGSQMITGLTLLVTGAESVTYNGGTHAVNAGRVSFLVGATSAPLTLTPSAADTRIQVSFVETGSEIRITNDSLISCIVSLRSDLSVVDPTLPESELNIEAYNEVDISAAVANIPEDTPIYYQAGYDTDTSPARHFYVSGQVTWADNVLSIHAVDAVHLLDVEVPPMYIDIESPDELVRAVWYFLRNFGLISTRPRNLPDFYKHFFWTGEAILIPKESMLRDVLAEMMNVVRYRNIPDAYLDDIRDGRNLVFSYVDAGIPRLSVRDEDTETWEISESDCGDIRKNVDRPVKQITYQRNIVTVFKNEASLSPTYDGVSVGTARIEKNSAIFVSLDDYVFCCFIGDEAEKYRPGYYSKYVPMIPMCPGRLYVSWPEFFADKRFKPDESIATPLLMSDTKNGTYSNKRLGVDYPIYTQVVPWNIRYSGDALPFEWTSTTQLWNYLVGHGFAESDANYFELPIIGYKLSIEDASVLVSSDAPGGISVETSGVLQGRSFFLTSNSSRPGEEAFPTYGLKEMLKRSNVTGSFTWKGDPRMQPRDIIHFHRLDGTTEDVTIETITLKHEGGGTTAEITYRKGVV